MPTETSITVESCLAELRELFPGKNTIRIGCVIQVGFANFAGDTLSDAMAQARAEAERRKKESQQ